MPFQVSGKGMRLWLVSAALAAAVLMSCSGNQLIRTPQTAGFRASSARHRHNLYGQFSHVIIIDQENRTVDNLFNGFPGADTVTTGDRFGQTVALQPVRLQPSPALDHAHAGFVKDYDNGLMDGFDHEFTGSDVGTAYEYAEPSDVANYWALASRFTLADEVFQANMGPSFPAHIAIIAGQTGYPFAVAGLPSTIGKAGCFGTNRVNYVDMRTQFPGTSSEGPACIEAVTIFDRLDAAGIQWRYYAPNYGIGINFWTGPDYVRHLAMGADHAYIVSPETQVIQAISNGTLPPVSYVMPESCTSDHPWQSSLFPLGGPKWVASITNAVGASPYWGNTLILVTWDDWGGWYDHVPPPILNANQLGFRTPLLIVSAYPANRGVPDHTVRNQASVITAIESIFNLPSLGQLDSQTDDLSSDFDFTASPQPYGSPLPQGTPPPKKYCNNDD